MFKPILELGALKPLKAILLPSLFEHLTADCHPVTTKSRRYSKSDNDFIAIEMRRLLAEEIIEPSISPWRAQVVVATNDKHQITLPVADRKYMAFEANGQLFQFTKMPFGLKNAVPCFQHIINKIIKKNGCKGTFAYLDNVTVAGKTQNEYDPNLKKFLSIAREYNITLDENKCFYSSDTIDLLGYQISNGKLQSDPQKDKTFA